MSTTAFQELSLRSGEWVEVRSKEEILSTLDANGRLDEMPFMPEMLKYCGQRFQVGKRAHKTCDPAIGIGGRRLERTVHLQALRCDGSAHDRCQAGCLIFWKDAWLKRVAPAAAGAEPDRDASSHSGPLTEAGLYAATRATPSNGSGEPIYTCQNTQVKFATRPMPWWEVRQYVEDYSSRNVSLGQMIAALVYTAWRTVAEAGIGLGSAMRMTYDSFQRLIGGTPYPLRRHLVPDGMPTPKAQLDLKVGELVRVRSHVEILKTLDSRYRNRGLYFDPDYVPFTGRTFRVKQRITQIIDERDGRMIRLKSDAIVLENVVCEGRYTTCRRFCPRAILPYWREVWLERVQPESSPRATAIETRESDSFAGANR